MEKLFGKIASDFIDMLNVLTVVVGVIAFIFVYFFFILPYLIIFRKVLQNERDRTID